MGFEELATRIQIVVIKAGSVVVVCWFPQNLEKLLVRISQKTLIQLTEMGVVMSSCWLDWLDCRQGNLKNVCAIIVTHNII